MKMSAPWKPTVSEVEKQNSATSAAIETPQRRHVARIWPREGRRNPGGLLSTEGLLPKGASFLQRVSCLHNYIYNIMQTFVQLSYGQRTGMFLYSYRCSVRNIRISQVSEWHGNWQKKTRAPAAAAVAAEPQQEGEDLRGMGGYWMTVRVTLDVLSYIVQVFRAGSERL